MKPSYISTVDDLNRAQEIGAVASWSATYIQGKPVFDLVLPCGTARRVSLTEAAAFLLGIQAERERVQLRHLEGMIS
jgi:hypothetical protein